MNIKKSVLCMLASLLLLQSFQTKADGGPGLWFGVVIFGGLIVGAVGASGYENYQGATQIYVRSGSTWTYQATLSQNTKAGFEGSGVILSADGNILAAGAPSVGVTQIYTRSGNIWTYQSTLSQHANLQEGHAVALSANGTTLAAGTYFSPGETFIYVN